NKFLSVSAVPTAFAVATQASAFDCPLADVPNSGAPCSHGTASGTATAQFTVSGNRSTWTYTFQYFAGPVFPTSSASLINSDGVTLTKNANTGNRCNPVVDGVGGGIGSKTCITTNIGTAGAPRFIRISIP